MLRSNYVGMRCMLGAMVHSPSIRVIDEADVGLGGTYCAAGGQRTRVEVQIESIYDRVAPFGILDMILQRFTLTTSPMLMFSSFTIKQNNTR